VESIGRNRGLFWWE